MDALVPVALLFIGACVFLPLLKRRRRQDEKTNSAPDKHGPESLNVMQLMRPDYNLEPELIAGQPDPVGDMFEDTHLH
ncbi:hypothetical protein [Pseudoxanthomonas mexicana]